MERRITFTPNDEDFIRKIIVLQREQNLPSFVAAVRVLCNNGLTMREAVEKMK